MRSGCIHDAMDGPQIREIELNAELVRERTTWDPGNHRRHGGHVSPTKISEYVSITNAKTGQRPLFVAGPLPIDIGVGYDHIAGCVGGALAAGAGADIYVILRIGTFGIANATRSEKSRAFRIAAHIGDT